MTPRTPPMNRLRTPVRGIKTPRALVKAAAAPGNSTERQKIPFGEPKFQKRSDGML
jgi:hypothetical protein